MTDAASTSTTYVGRDVRRGTPVVPGIAIGPVIRPTASVDVSGAVSIVAEAPDKESERFDAAVRVVASRLDARSQEAHGVAAEVLTAQVGLVTDKGLRKSVEKAISAGSSAEAAVVAAVDQFAAMFEQVGGLMAERVTDLRDLGGRVYAELRGLP